MTPSQPSELDKAIERLEHEITIQLVPDQLGMDLQTLLLAAKRSKELEKENERLILLAEKQMAVLTGAARPNVEIAEELSTLRADYKQALHDMEEIRYHDLRDSHVAADCFVCERLNRILSTPSAIAMKGEV